MPDPLWIVADDTLSELEWSLRSEPLIHLAIGMGLVEELRAVRKPLSDYQLGKILRMPLESVRHLDSLFHAPITYSNYKQFFESHPNKVARLTE